jgi:hypothetical protein
MAIIEIIGDALSNKVNIIFVVIIFALAFFDLKKKKDLKSQIVSVGVLGTFVGIFIGLQDFNPEDMKNSINYILVGLKTAFFTSIVGMATAIILAVYQRLKDENLDDEKNEERILLDISKKLDKLDNASGSDSSENILKIVEELEKSRKTQEDTAIKTQDLVILLTELKNNSTKENQKLIDILDVNFDKMNRSLEIAIEKLSKGATEEIINALKQVIEEFNQELQSQFGDNFVKLNESVVNLVEWQNNYKKHVETLEDKLEISSESIEKSKESLEIISSKNKDILNVYKELKHIIDIYDRQIKDLSQHLETYSNLSNNAEDMFTILSKSIESTKEEYTSLTEHIRLEHTKQKEDASEINKLMASDLKIKTTEIKTNFDTLTHSFEKNKNELNLVSNHFKNLGEQIPKALQISLEELNGGLTMLTTKFQKDYKNVMDKYRGDN